MRKELYKLHRVMWADSTPEEIRKYVQRKAIRSLYTDMIESEGGLEHAIKVFKPSEHNYKEYDPQK